MEFLKSFADYLWVITKILALLILIIAILLTMIKSIFGKTRRNKVDEEDIDNLFKKKKK